MKTYLDDMIKSDKFYAIKVDKHIYKECEAKTWRYLKIDADDAALNKLKNAYKQLIKIGFIEIEDFNNTAHIVFAGSIKDKKYKNTVSLIEPLIFLKCKPNSSVVKAYQNNLIEISKEQYENHMKLSLELLEQEFAALKAQPIENRQKFIETLDLII